MRACWARRGGFARLSIQLPETVLCEGEKDSSASMQLFGFRGCWKSGPYSAFETVSGGMAMSER